MAGFRLTPRAREGLLQILEYVESEFGVHVAERVLDELATAFRRIALNPGMGHLRRELTQDPLIRFWSVGPSLIAYRTPGEGPVEILFIERGERDWRQVMAEDS